MSSNNVLNTLVDIRYWFRDQNKWVSGALARDEDGDGISENLSPDNRKIVGMCVSGAAYLKSGVANPNNYMGNDPVITPAFNHYEEVMRELTTSGQMLYPDCDGPVDVNDSMGYDAVMRMLDHAIIRVATPLYEQANREYEQRKAEQSRTERIIQAWEVRWLAEQAEVKTHA